MPVCLSHWRVLKMKLHFGFPYALNGGRFGWQGTSSSAPPSSGLGAANVYPAPESLRKLRSKFSLSSHRLRQSSSNRYWRHRGPERDASGENDFGTIAG